MMSLHMISGEEVEEEKEVWPLEQHQVRMSLHLIAGKVLEEEVEEKEGV